MTKISIQMDSAEYARQDAVEVVERKGYGHPDTLCDRISELTSVLYSQYCIENFGKIGHHWFDKVMLIGGEANLGFGVGELTSPYEVILAGKAATSIGEVEIPLTRIFENAARKVLLDTLHYFNPSTDLLITNRIKSGRGHGQPVSRYRPISANEMAAIDEPELVSNDCNLCTAYYPLSTLEEVVLSIDHEFLKENEARWFGLIGSDIKTVGWRRYSNYTLAVNAPFLAKKVYSRTDYIKHCEDLEKNIHDWVSSRWEIDITVTVNPERKWKRSYLTLTGTVADTGDVGVTGRGNRMNGLITPGRNMSIEAVAGKNPLDHTGKLYNALAYDLAKAIYYKISSPCKVSISTLKGVPLNCPIEITVSVSNSIHTHEEVEKIVHSLVHEGLLSIKEISRRFISGNQIRVC